MDRVNPDWQERLRREIPHIEHPGFRGLAIELLSEPEETGKNSPKTKIQQRAAAICRETWQVANAGHVSPGYYDTFSGKYKPVPQLSVPDPPKLYEWTR